MYVLYLHTLTIDFSRTFLASLRHVQLSFAPPFFHFLCCSFVVSSIFVRRNKRHCIGVNVFVDIVSEGKNDNGILDIAARCPNILCAAILPFPLFFHPFLPIPSLSTCTSVLHFVYASLSNTALSNQPRYKMCCLLHSVCPSEITGPVALFNSFGVPLSQKQALPYYPTGGRRSLWRRRLQVLFKLLHNYSLHLRCLQVTVLNLFSLKAACLLDTFYKR